MELLFLFLLLQTNSTEHYKKYNKWEENSHFEFN